jgi:hypothetical protein
MKIFKLTTQGGYLNNSFAACRLGDWVESHQPNKLSWWKWGNVCPNCRTTVEILVEPLQMRWIEGSALIGDFVGSGPYTNHLLVQQKVIDFFNHHDYFSTYHNVEFLANPPISPRSRKPRYPIVPTPYTGPKLINIRAKYGVHFNLEKTGIKYELMCSLCGYKNYDPSHDLDLDKKMIVIDEEEWNGLRSFKIFDMTLPIAGEAHPVYVSEEGRDILLKQGFTNMWFREVGRIEKAGTGKILPYREKTVYPYWKPEEYVESPVQPKKKTPKNNKNTK